MKRNMKNKKVKLLFITISSFVLILMVFLSLRNSFLEKTDEEISSAKETIIETINVPLEKYGVGEEQDFIYLSDIHAKNDGAVKKAQSGWGSIGLDKASDNSLISVKIEGGYYSFPKGIWAHASSELIYDFTNYSQYDFFTAYIGLNKTASSSSNGVIYHIYTSTDGNTWTEVEKENGEKGWSKKPGENATFVKINIQNANFLKLVADSNGSNGNDHSVYADAKLVKRTYKEPGEELVPDIEELDNEIKNKFPNGNTANLTEAKRKEYETLLFKRELINNVGTFALRKFLSASEENEATYEWLTETPDVLKLYVLGGTPEGGNYYSSLTQLSRLYNEYEIDFTNTTRLGNKWNPNLTYGDLYKKMAITLSLTHAQPVRLWMQPSAAENQSDALKRYAIFKYLHKNEKLVVTRNDEGEPVIDITPWFETLQIEEMRFIMNNAIDDEEILWLNAYVQQNIDENQSRVWSYLTPHPYMAYVWPNYGNSIYYDEANKAYFNEQFGIKNAKDSEEKTGMFDLEYTIPGGKENPTYTIKITRGTTDYKLYKVWMNFRNKFGTGAVCGGISKTGSNIRTTHGIPATVIGQPGHAALLYYTKVDDPANPAYGKGYWGIDNDVSGWTLSEKGERMLLGWGNDRYSRGYSVVYMILAQEAINNYDNLVKCEEEVMRAKLYNGDLAKQEEIYRKAIEIQPINIDAWYGLINVYNQSTTKTENDYYDLAEDLAENLKCFPLPMYHLTNLIKPKLTSVENSFRFTLLQTRTLEEGSTYNGSEVLQPSVTRIEANHLLGKLDKTLATFSFDGEDAGKIVLSSRYDTSGIRWDYCLGGEAKALAGKQNYTEVSFTANEPHKLQLTKNQINSITAENDIYIHIVGTGYEAENLYKIDITTQANIANLYANDLENRVIGVNLNTEWRYNENDNWISYKVASPDLTGNKTVQVRQAATGTKLASEATELYRFTPNNDTDIRKYVPIARLSIAGVSTEATSQGRHATNAIDGNYNTNWHSAWNGTDTQRFITIKLDSPINLSEVEYVPGAGGNGRIIDGTIYGSMDGENWEVLKTVTNLQYTGNANAYEFGFNNTKNFEIENHPEVQYVKIVANRASNGNWFTVRMFNFYEDVTNRALIPTADIAYSPDTTTNGEVIARLVNPSTKITITNNGGSDTYVFTENNKPFTFEFVDENGTKGSATANVTWIDKDIPTAEIKYNLDNDRNLVVLLGDINENVYLLNENNEKMNYIEVKDGKVVAIQYLDASGDIYKTTEVDENGIVTKVTYKNTTGVAENVAIYSATVRDGVITADSEEYFDAEGNSIDPETISAEDKEVLRGIRQSITNPLEHTFETSGEYEFKLLDKASNMAYKSIKVDYIDNDTTILASDITYSTTAPTSKPVVATINPYIIDTEGKNVNVEIVNNNKSNTYTFTENGEFTFEYKNVLDTNNWEVKTHTAKVDWITPVIKGDLDKDGKITPNDLAKVKLHYIKLSLLQGEEIDIGDIDGDGQITMNDIARIKLMIIGLIK